MVPALAIFDADEVYAFRLAQYANNQLHRMFSASSFSNAASLLAYMADNKDAIVAIGETVFSTLSMDKSADIEWDKDKTVLLTATDSVTDVALPSVNKYIPAETVLKRIAELTVARQLAPKPMNAMQKKDNISICIASPFGGSYRTTLSVYLSNVLSFSRSTLLISMDPFFTPIRYGLPCGDGALTKCISDLTARDGEFNERLGVHITKGGSFDGLYGCDHWADVTEMTLENAQRLMLSAKCCYDAVVVDVSDLYRAGAGFIDICDFVFTPMQGSAETHGKLPEWKRQLAMMGIDADSRLQMLNVPFDEAVASGQCLISDTEHSVLGEYAKFLAKRCIKDD